MTEDGRWTIGDAALRWRIGRIDHPSQARDTAESWLSALAIAEGLVAWTGIERPAPHTKPRLQRTPGWDLSISHSADMLLVAIGRGGLVGADVERAPFGAFRSAALVRRMCSSDERARVEGVRGHARSALLAQIWTAKEAVTKATGQGLAVDFRGFDVSTAGPLRSGLAEAHLALIVADSPHLLRISLTAEKARSYAHPAPLAARAA